MNGIKLKQFLLIQGISHRLINTLKLNNSILCNNSPIPINGLLHYNDIVCIDFSYKEESENIIPVKIPLSIIYEDEALLVINKPAGIPVHPSLHYYESSLSNGVKYYFNEIRII